MEHNPFTVVISRLRLGGVVSKIFVIFIAVVIGLNQGAQPILGFNYGAKKYSRVHDTMKLLLKITVILSTILWMIFQAFPLQLIQMFGSGDALYYEFGVRYARAFLFFTFINGTTIIVTTFFPAIGKAKLGAILSLTRQMFVLASSDDYSCNKFWSRWINFLRPDFRLYLLYYLYYQFIFMKCAKFQR